MRLKPVSCGKKVMGIHIKLYIVKSRELTAMLPFTMAGEFVLNYIRLLNKKVRLGFNLYILDIFLKFFTAQPKFNFNYFYMIVPSHKSEQRKYILLPFCFCFDKLHHIFIKSNLTRASF